MNISSTLRWRHPVNVQQHRNATLGERAAEGMATAVGSWRFIIIQSILVAIWLGYNGYAAIAWLSTGVFDPFPYVLLNLMFSVQAAYTGPILLISANRAARRDRELAEHDHELAEQHSVMLGTLKQLLDENTKLTRTIEDALTENTNMTRQVRELTVARSIDRARSAAAASSAAPRSTASTEPSINIVPNKPQMGFSHTGSKP